MALRQKKAVMARGQTYTRRLSTCKVTATRFKQFPSGLRQVNNRTKFIKNY